jgi:hypothetical protein
VEWLACLRVIDEGLAGYEAADVVGPARHRDKAGLMTLARALGARPGDFFGGSGTSLNKPA